ncbi:MAG: hypothetical protein ABIK89_17305 [Planctomycetota bacterium]
MLLKDKAILAAAACLVLRGAIAPGATVLFCPFQSLEGWSVRAVGATGAAIAKKSATASCVEVTSRGGTVFLTRQLPIEAVRGRRVTVGCLVESEEVVRGPQVSSTGKLHLAVETPSGVRHFGARFVGTSEWHLEGITADVPSNAQRVLLNLGLEACSGRVRFDRLVVKNDQRGVHPLSLASTANADHEQLGLGAFPKGTLEWEGITFQIMDAAKHGGRDCFRLRGLDHPDWPATSASPISVGTAATAIYILHGALEGREKSDTPSAIWSTLFADGPGYGLSLFEGRQIGAIGQTDDLENWRVAWRQEDPSGGPITFGVTKWDIYSDSPILSLTCQAYRGAAPVVLAVTVVEEPPAREPEAEEYDEFGNPVGEGAYE